MSRTSVAEDADAFLDARAAAVYGPETPPAPQPLRRRRISPSADAPRAEHADPPAAAAIADTLSKMGEAVTALTQLQAGRAGSDGKLADAVCALAGDARDKRDAHVVRAARNTRNGQSARNVRNARNARTARNKFSRPGTARRAKYGVG